MRAMIVLALVLCGLSRPVCAQPAQAGTVAVTTATAERRPVADTADFVGRVEAVDRVEVRARITGYLDAVRFKEGDVVKDGAPLYEIEKGLLEAAVQQAQGALERSKAAKALTAIQLQRAQELLKTNSGTVVARDQAVAADQQAQGAMLADEANLSTAKINLGYTDIRSPITGKIGRTNVTKGNVVGPDSGVLTTIVSQDPMYVTFPVSQREFLRVEEAGQQADTNNIQVRLRFADGTLYDHVGEINFVDVTVDRSTDTVLVRATIRNPKGALVDGQLMTVVLEAAKPEERVVIPQAALIADQQGVYVFVVEDGKAVAKRVKPGGLSGTDVTIDAGLAGGEQVIVEGIQRVRPGVPVQAAPVTTPLGRS